MIRSNKRTGAAAAIDCLVRTQRSWFALATLILAGGQPAHANQCFTDGPRYQLESDTVEWKMTIRSNESCLRGVRFSYVYNTQVSLVSPPRFGQVALVGPGFSFIPKSDYRGEDSFVIGVSGSKLHTRGFSTIHVIVSVVGAEQAGMPSHAHFSPN